MKKSLAVSAAAVLVLSGSTLLAGADHAKNTNKIAKHVHTKASSGKHYVVTDDNVDESYNVSKIYNKNKHRANDDNYDEHL